MGGRRVEYFHKDLAAPESYDTCLFCLPAAYVPYIFSAIEGFKARGFWESDEAYARAYEVLSETQAMLLNPQCDISFEIRRLYRLIDTTLNGRAYVVDPTAETPDNITPDIPAVPEPGYYTMDGARYQFERIADASEATAADVNAGLIGDGDEVLLQLLLGLI